MKKSTLLFSLLFLAGFALAQRPTPAKVQQQTYPVLTTRATIKLYAADLVPHQQAILNSNGKRYIKAYTLNTGKSASKSCYLTVIYRWKFDYENFTKKELVKQYTIEPLDPNEATSVIFQVPDDQISSNPPYGSTYVSIELKVDGTSLVFEADEQNNSKALSLPIIND